MIKDVAYFYDNWDRDLGNGVFVVSVRPAEANCTLSVLCSLWFVSFNFVNIRFYLGDLCCCFP